MASLIAFVSIFVESPYMDDVVQELSRLDKVVDLYEVTGEFDIVTVVSASDIEEFRDVLKNKIMKVKGVKSTVSSIVLKTHKGSGANRDILNATSAVAASFSQRK
jgi:Lrp/AsnC family transcriptional regulator for asnA, asnC and gidA